MEKENKICSLGISVGAFGLICFLLSLISGFSFFGILSKQFWITIAVCLIFVISAGFFIKKKLCDKPLVPILFLCGTASFFVLYTFTVMYGKPIYLVTYGFVILASIFISLALTKNLSLNTALALLIFAGFVLRLEYILITDIYESLSRQHDVSAFGQGSGHSGYIEYLYNNLSLPDFDPRTKWQFYHPPLHHILAAAFLKLQVFLKIPYGYAVEGIQFLTLFYSTAATLIGVKLCRLLGLRGRFLLISAAVLTFSPAFILFAGSVNNDILSVLFVFAAMYSAYKWFNTDKTSSFFLTALFIGLGMMTKLSASIVAIPIAGLMLVYFIKTKKKLNCLAKYSLFGVIVAPLGLWWYIRNIVLFSVPMQYVPSANAPSQYVGFRSFAERFIPFSGMGNTPYFCWGDKTEYNAWSGLFKSSAMGEYNLGEFSAYSGNLAGGLLMFTLLVCIASFIAMIYVLIFEKVKGKWYLFSMYTLTLISFLYFCYEYPHTCTMNVRYATPLILIGAFFASAALQKSEQRKQRGSNEIYGIFYKIAYSGTQIFVGGYAVLSIAAYALLER